VSCLETRKPGAVPGPHTSLHAELYRADPPRDLSPVRGASIVVGGFRGGRGTASQTVQRRFQRTRTNRGENNQVMRSGTNERQAHQVFREIFETMQDLGRRP
jgi:hypothetical protein